MNLLDLHNLFTKCLETFYDFLLELPSNILKFAKRPWRRLQDWRIWLRELKGDFLAEIAIEILRQYLDEINRWSEEENGVNRANIVTWWNQAKWSLWLEYGWMQFHKDKVEEGTSKKNKSFQKLHFAIRSVFRSLSTKSCGMQNSLNKHHLLEHFRRRFFGLEQYNGNTLGGCLFSKQISPTGLSPTSYSVIDIITLNRIN